MSFHWCADEARRHPVGLFRRRLLAAAAAAAAAAGAVLAVRGAADPLAALHLPALPRVLRIAGSLPIFLR